MCDSDSDCGGGNSVKCSDALFDASDGASKSDFAAFMHDVKLQDGSANVATCSTVDTGEWKLKPGGMLGFVKDTKNWFNRRFYRETVTSSSASLKICYPAQSEVRSDNELNENLLDDGGNPLMTMFEDTVNNNKKTFGSYMAPFYSMPLSTRKLNGEKYYTPPLASQKGSVATVGYMNCRGAFGMTPALMPGVGFAMQSALYRPLMSHLMETVQKILECRASAAGKDASDVLTLQQFRIGYEIWQLDWLLQYFSTDGSSYTHAATWTEPSGSFRKSWNQLLRTDWLSWSPEPTARRALAAMQSGSFRSMLHETVAWAAERAEQAYASHSTRAVAAASAASIEGFTRRLQSQSPATTGSYGSYATAGASPPIAGSGSSDDAPLPTDPPAPSPPMTLCAQHLTPGLDASAGTYMKWNEMGQQECSSCARCPCGGAMQPASGCGGWWVDHVGEWQSDGAGWCEWCEPPTPAPTPGNDGMMHKIAMPASCNFASYSDVGSCLLKYTGATNVINPWRADSPAGTLADPAGAVKLDFNIEMSRCSGDASESLPAGAFGLSGQWASVLRDVTPCSTDNECAQKFGAGVQCFDAAADDTLDLASVEMPTGFMFPDLREGEPGFATHAQCTANVHLRRAARKAIMALAGKEDNSGSSALKFCAPDVQGAVDSIEANSERIGDALEPTEDEATEVISVPHLVSDTADALWYPGKPSATQTKVVSAATYPGITVADFTSVRQMAFKRALASSLTTDAASPFDESKIEITDIVPAAGRRMLTAGGSGVTVSYEIEAEDAAAAAAVDATITSPTTGVASAAFNQDVYTATADLTPPIQPVPVLATTEAECDKAEAAGIPCTTNANITNRVQASNTELTAEQPASVVETAPPIAAADIADLTPSPTPAPDTFAPTLAADAAADATFAPAPATAAPTPEPTAAAPAGSAPEVQTSAPQMVADREGKVAASNCDKITNEKGHELCKKAEDNKAAVAGGIAGGVVFLAILAKCWHKMKFSNNKPAAEPQATAVQLELARSAGSAVSTV